MNEPVFEIKDANFSYLGKFKALCGVNMKILAGQKITIIGANGSGKSTLLQMLDGLIFPQSGSISAFGRELKESVFNEELFALEFRKKVGFVFQNPDIQLFCPTVKEDILFGPLQLGLDKAQIKKDFDYITGFLEIGDLLDRAPYQLSIGEKRKVAIASTLILDPQVLILDEPTAGLDPLTTRHIIDLLIHDNLAGKTIITSTHDLHIVEEISDLVYVFSHEKKIVKSAGPDEILGDLQLLKENNLLHIHGHSHDGKTHIHPHLHIYHQH